MATAYCSDCRRNVEPVRPALWFWRLALGAGILVTTAVVAFCACLGPVMVAVAPIVMIIGPGIISPLVAQVQKKPHCGACAKELVLDGAPVPALAPALLSRG